MRIGIRMIFGTLLIGCGNPSANPTNLNIARRSPICESRVMFYSQHWGRDGTLNRGPECVAPSAMPEGATTNLVDVLNDRRTIWPRANNVGDVTLLRGVSDPQHSPAHSTVGVSTEEVWIVFKSPVRWLWCVSLVVKNHCDSFDFLLTGQSLLFGSGSTLENHP